MLFARTVSRAVWHLTHTPAAQWPELLRLNAIWLFERIPPLLFDWLHGVETGGLLDRATILGDEPGLAEVTWYEATSPRHFRAVLRQVDLDFGQTIFVDVGCGKGRVLLLASQQPFRKVIGVELSPMLVAAARDNLRRYRGRLRCRQIEVIQGDIRHFRWPSGPVVIYCFNPFRGALFADFLSTLLAARAHSAEPTWLIYSNPVEHDRIFACRRFATIAVGRTAGPSPSPVNRRYGIYRLLPDAPGAGP
jgi:SAM-dependent methyltransferase